MTMQTFLLICFLAASLAAVAVLGLVLNHQQQKRWMRIFSEKQGIPAASMESKPADKEVARQEKPRKKLLSVPIPGADMLKNR